MFCAVEFLWYLSSPLNHSVTRRRFNCVEKENKFVTVVLYCILSLPPVLIIQLITFVVYSQCNSRLKPNVDLMIRFANCSSKQLTLVRKAPRGWNLVQLSTGFGRQPG